MLLIFFCIHSSFFLHSLHLAFLLFFLNDQEQCVCVCVCAEAHEAGCCLTFSLSHSQLTAGHMYVFFFSLSITSISRSTLASATKIQYNEEKKSSVC